MKLKNSFILATGAFLVLAHSILAQDEEAQRQKAAMVDRLQPIAAATGGSSGNAAVVAYDDRTGATIVQSQDGKKLSIARTTGSRPPLAAEGVPPRTASSSSRPRGRAAD